MSKESMEWLNTNTLIGLTDKRGTAWHWRSDLQGAESNHYPGFIPVGDVERRLFGFEAVQRDLMFLKPVDSNTDLSFPTVAVDGVRYSLHSVTDHRAVCDDDDFVLGVQGADWQIHGYRPWLLDNVATVIGGDLGISSSGLLRQRRQAWVEISVPENIDTPEGVTFRPNLLAFTSMDASLATTYKRTIGFVVCDNTLAARIGEDGEQVKFRHTSGSAGRIGDARQALGLITRAAEDFQTELTELCSVEVSAAQWSEILDKLAPYPRDENGKVIGKGRSFTMAETKRFKLDELYRFDTRCAPWQGTKFGVIQTANTWKTHHATVRKAAHRAERQMANVIGGQLGHWDEFVANTVDDVLAMAS